MTGPVGDQPDGQGPDASVGLFFPVMVVAGNLFIMINLIFVAGLGWWSLAPMAAEAVAGLVLGVAWFIRTRKNAEENKP